MIRIVNLQSGVRLVLEKMDNVRSTCVGIWCNNGSANERPEEYGISHFIEHMLFKGTENRTAFDIVDAIDRTGGEINAFTGKETTCFYVKCLDEHLLKSCDVLVDMIENPLFDRDELEREKLVIIEEINMCADDPDELAMDELDEVLYHGSTMSHRILGTSDTVTSFTPEILRNYYDEHYTRDSIVVSVAGSFDEDEIIEYFSSHFEGLRSEQRKDEKGELNAKTGLKTIVKDIEQAHIAMGIETVPGRDERKYCISLLNTIMGGGMSSRLFQQIREKKGLAYSVYSLAGSYTETGSFVICMGVSKNRVEEALDAVSEELSHLREGITESEFASAKEQVKSSFIFAQESVKSRMRTNGRNLLALGECPSQEDVLADVDRITVNQVNAVIDLISDMNRYSIVNVTGR